jgi:hypothetical protein
MLRARRFPRSRGCELRTYRPVNSPFSRFLFAVNAKVVRATLAQAKSRRPERTHGGEVFARFLCKTVRPSAD